MKILLIDPISPIGHKNFDNGVLRCLSGIKDLQIDVIIRKDFIDVSQNRINTITYIEDKYIPDNVLKKSTNIYQYRVLMRFNQYIFLKKIFKKIKNMDYDMILFTGIDLISFSLASRGINKRCAYIDHSISDLVDNKLKLFFWKRINKKFESILMEDYINDYVRNIIKARDITWVVHHSLPIIDRGLLNGNIEHLNKKLVFSPGESIDEKFLGELIENCDLIPNDIIIIIKSKETVYKSEKLIVYNHRLTDMEYYGYLNNCSYLLIAYIDCYNYKTSGVFYEAVKLYKKVLIHSNNTLVKYCEMYPKNVIGFNNVNDLFSLLNKNSSDIDKEEMDLINNNYSDDKITDQLANVIYNKS